MESQKRGKNLALIGAVLQVVFAVAVLSIGVLTGARSAVACAWFLAGGVLVWLMVAVLFYCRQLERQEETELADLAARGEEGGLFAGEQDLSLRPARARREFVERWVVPGFTLLLAGYHVALGVLVLTAVRFFASKGAPAPITGPGQGILFSVLVGFVAFLFSRYCTGMGSQAQWRPLRAGASCLLVGALTVGGVVAGLLGAWWGYRTIDVVIAFAVPILQFVLAAELLVSFVLDLYRPRVPGREARLAFDSRLFNLLAEPGRVGHSIAETLNYQFGFEVSGTWFYRLLSKAMIPLLIFGAVVLVGLSCVVIVYQGQQCVVLHWGRRDQGRLLGAGLHVKWPWPVDSSEHFDVGRVHELRVGVGEEQRPIVVRGREMRLWTSPHGRYRELDFLVAVPPEVRQRSSSATQPAGEAQEKDLPPPVSIIKLVAAIQYRIADAYKFGYRYTDAAKVLQCAAYREMVRYCASATLEEELDGGDANRPEAIMTSGWTRASRALGERIRRAVGDGPGGLDLGVAIETVKLVAVHPPAEAADAFEKVLAAERGQDEQRYQAEGAANRMLSAVAGDPDSALALALAIRRLEQLEGLADVRNRPAEFQQSLRGHLLRAAKDLRMLLVEIRREGLLGKLGRSGEAPAKAEGAGLAAQLGGHVGKLDGRLKEMIEQIVSDPLLERLEPGSGTPKRRLAAHHGQHLLQLLEIRSAAGRFDFAGGTRQARLRADGLFDRATGEPAQKVAQAEAFRWRHEMAERARAESFRRELLAYQASPRMYLLDRWLDVWDEVLPDMDKYVLGVDREKIELWLNWERQTMGFEGAFEGQGEPTEPTEPKE